MPVGNERHALEPPVKCDSGSDEVRTLFDGEVRDPNDQRALARMEVQAKEPRNVGRDKVL